jgi:peptidoglycan/xylan/chitin deacetylase (PgdA/CDA1 family)
MKEIISFARRPFAALGRKVLGTITSVSTSHPMVALTFDDGPHPEFTLRMLEILSQHQARATFFMLGKYAQKYPDIVEKVALDGHAIGNHSWDHPSFPLITSRERRRQIRSCGDALVPHGLRIFRPPFGHQTIRTRLDALLLGYQVVGWDIAADDWLDHDARQIAERVGEKMKPGSIILFHDALATVLDERYESREQTLEAVTILLKNIGDRFQFITIPDLLQHGRPRRENWQREGQKDFFSRLREPGGKP